jgi:PAS domain S-box-containing protein/putative nucleotidyltransferase with HDIG domain
MGRPLRVLIIEDSEDDTQLLLRELRRSGHEVEFERVETAEALQSALTQKTWDLILSDYNLPGFDGLQALDLLKASGQDLPFILISGTIDEETAVAALKAGADDFLVKGKFARLAPAIARELREAKTRREHKRVEEALKSSETRYRLAARATNDVIWEWDSRSNELMWSENAQSVFGYVPEEINAEAAWWDDHIHPEDRERVVSDIYALLESGGTIWADEYRFLRRDGSIAHIVDRAYVERDTDGKPLRMIGAMSDITERKQAEEALAASASRYRMLFKSNPHPMWIYDLETLRFLAVNDAAVEHYRYSQDEFLSMTIQEIRPAEDMPALIANLAESQQDLHNATVWRHYKKDGTLIDVEITSHFVQWKERPARLVLANDITERKRAEEALREKEWLLSEAQRIGHIGSWSYDIAADTFVYSDEMYRLFDISPEEFKPNSAGFLDRIYSSDRPMVAKWIKDIKAGSQAGGAEFLIFRKNSELRYIRCRGAVEVDKAGRPARFIGTAQDVTERKLAEIQIHQQIEHLTALRKIDQAISSSFDLNVTLDVLLSQVISQLQVDAADVLLLEPDRQTLTYATGKGFRTQAVETGRLHMADSQAGRAARERRLIHVENLEYKPDRRLLTSLGISEGFVCYFSLPLIVKGKVKGVLEIFHRAPLQPYPEWLDFLNTLAGQAAIAIEDAQLFENLERSNRELSQAYDATIEGWSRALDLRDKETEGHTLRVTEMTLNLAHAFGLPEEELLHIRRGGLLHDIGKMGVPDNILLKPGALTEEEWVRMRSHPQYAYDLLKPIAFLAHALDIPYCHHEKWDGTGYPRGLKGEEIPLVARLFAVVDVWDALRSDRPYRKAWTKEKALEHIQSLSGTHFDPQAVEYFLELIKV